MTVQLATTIKQSRNGMYDAFGRLRTSDARTIFDCKHLFDAQSLWWDDAEVSGAGTSSAFVTNQSMMKMSVSNLTAGARVRQTRRRMNYQPLHSMLIGCTAVMGTPKTGITCEVAYGDEKNALFFRQESTDMHVGIRTFTSGSAVESHHVERADWDDKMDGQGRSGISVDFTKNQVMVVDFQWLSAGAIRFGIDIGGTLHYCHEITNANALTMPYMQTPNLPVRYKIANDGTGPAADLYQICTAVLSEGGRSDGGFVLYDDVGTTALSVTDTNIHPLILMRLLSTSIGATIFPIEYSLSNPTTSLFRYALILNPTITGTAPSYATVPNSAVQTAKPTGATAITAGTGNIVHSGYFESTNASSTPPIRVLPSQLSLGSSIAGTSDVLALAVQVITGGTESFYGSIGWREEI